MLTLSSCFFSSSACFSLFSFKTSFRRCVSASTAPNLRSASSFSLVKQSLHSANWARKKVFSLWASYHTHIHRGKKRDSSKRCFDTVQGKGCACMCANLQSQQTHIGVRGSTSHEGTVHLQLALSETLFQLSHLLLLPAMCQLLHCVCVKNLCKISDASENLALPFNCKCLLF